MIPNIDSYLRDLIVYLLIVPRVHLELGITVFSFNASWAAAAKYHTT